MQLVKLEQNYRSMGRILEVANHLISNNPRPFEKTLWSELGFGDPINVLVAENETREAEKVVAAIMQDHFKHQSHYSDYAILYRGNHQSRIFEEKLREMRIPYHISGGISFFERSEIKDLMSYLRILVNDKDDNAFTRAINSPRRGFGAGGLEKLGLFAGEQKSALLVAARHQNASSILSSRQYAPLSSFVNQLESWQEAASDQNANQTLQQIIDDIDFRTWIDSNSKSVEQSDARWRNVEELLDWMHRLGNNSESIEEVVNKMSLMDILSRDDEDEDADRVSLMTMHAAKGLEFPAVFIVGVEEELLPHRNSIQQGTLEEERRLFYVGITRARRQLSLSFARKRSRFGEIIDCTPSRFFNELPDQHLRWDNVEKPSDADKQSVARAHLAAMRSALSN
jgi:ATP-dependent DNA helicase Rep